MKVIREILRLLWKVVRLLLARLLGWLVAKLWIYAALAVAVMILALVLVAAC